MIKPASSLCNLRCKYCFYCDVAAHRDEFSLGVMELQTAENLIKSALQFADGSSVAFAFQGGEPTIIGLDFYRFIIAEWKEFLNDKGIFAFECGENQADDISELLEKNRFDSFIIKDYNNIDRIVIGRRL
jgi:uncharacterized protein